MSGRESFRLRAIYSWTLGLLALLWSAWPSGLCAAQEGGSTNTPSGEASSPPFVVPGNSAEPSGASLWRLRRVLVPESGLSEVIEGSYLPIPRERFDALVEAEREASRPPMAERALAQVILVGRLDADGCLQGAGTAWLEEAAAAGWIESRPPSFWLGRARWKELERTREVLGNLTSMVAPEANRPATGLESGANPMSRASSATSALPAEAGRFGAIQGWGPTGSWTLEGIGATELGFDWMALPEGNSGREAAAPSLLVVDSTSSLGGPGREFLLSMPQAVRLVVFLDLPETLRVETNDGLVRVEQVAGGLATVGLRRWRVDLAPGAAGRIRLVSASASITGQTVQLLRYETQTLGRVGVGSIELRTTVRVAEGESGDLIWSCPEGWNPVWEDTTGGGVRPEVMPLEPGASKTSGTRWRWRGFTSSGGSAPSDRSYTIVMRREFDLDSRVTLSTPGIEGLWQRGRCELAIDPRITMQEVELRAGNWTASRSGMGVIEGDGERRLHWEETGEDSSISFVAALEREGFRGVALTELLAEGGKVSASCRAWLRAVGEPRFVWHGRLSDGWVVDRISAIETGVPDVSLVEGWDLVPSETGGIRLEVRFSQPLRPGREVMVTVDAHRLSFPSPVDALSSEELRLIAWDSTAQVRHWLGLRAESPYRLDGGRAIPAPSVTGEFDERIAAWRVSNPSSALMLLDGRPPAEFALRAESDESLEVEVEIDATLFERSTRQEVVMRCRPVGGRPTNLRVAWDRPSQGDWQWRLYLPSRGLSYPVQTLEDGLGAGESLLSWGMGIDESFELVGIGTESWESDWRPRLPVRFRNGIMTVSSRARSVLRCTVEGDARLPASVASLPADSQLLSVVDLSMLGTPLTVVRTELPTTVASRESGTTGYIEQAVLESWPGADETRHRLRLEFSDVAPKAVSLTPPEGARWTTTIVGDRRYRPEQEVQGTAEDGPARVANSPSPGGKIELRDSAAEDARERAGASSPVWILPIAEHRPGETIEIEYLTPLGLPAVRGGLDSAFPGFDLPVISRRWRLHLPVGYEFVAGAGGGPRNAWNWIFERWTGVAWRGLASVTNSSTSSLPRVTQASLGEAKIVELVPSDLSASRVVLIRRPMWDWVSISLIFGIAFLGAWTAGRQALGLIPLAGLVALWLPESWADLSWTLLPASALSVLLTRVGPGLSRGTKGRDERVSVTGQRAWVAGLLLLLVSWRGTAVVTESFAQETRQGPVASAAEGQRNQVGGLMTAEPEVRTATLYVPVDTAGNERTDLIYVPREFYDALVREAPRRASSPAWLVEAARHTVEAESNPFGDRPRMRVTSRYRVRTLERGISWSVPTWGDRLAIQPGQVQLDSMPARLSGTALGELRVAIETLGLHEVSVTAAGLVGDEGIAWEGTAPPVIDSEIRLASLAGQGLSVMTPLFWLETDRLGGGRRMRPGPTGTVQLASRERAESSAPESPIAMLGYLEPSEDGARMTLWLTAGAKGKLPERLSLRVRGEWEVATEASPAGVELRVTRGVAETQCVVIPGGGDQPPESIAIRLVANRGIALGRQPLPQVLIDDHPVGARFLAWRQPNQVIWTIENELGLALTGIDSAASWWTGSQLAAMGLPERERRLAVRPVEGHEWLRVAPVEPILDVDHQWQVRVAATQMRWEASSVVSVMRGEVAALELSSTLPMDLESVRLAGPDRSDPVEFLWLSPERVLLRLPSSQRTTFQLLLRGSFRGAPLVSHTLPILDFPRIASITHRATFERTPEVSVLLEPESEPSLGSVASERETFVAAWQTARRGELLGERADARRWAAWRWRWQPTNEARIDRGLTRFVRDGNAWRVTLDLHVADDETWGADRLDFEVPTGFSGLEGQVAGRWETASPTVPVGLARFIPDQRIAAGSWVRLEGRLARFPDGKTAPRIISSIPTRRLIAVPPAGKDDAFLWKYERYRPIDDAESLTRLPTERNWLLLEAEDAEASIRLASKPQIARPARVFLAEHRIETQEEVWLVDSRMLVDPGGRRRLALRLPEPSKVIAITIDGEVREIGNDGMFELTSRELPQVVRVLVQTTVDACIQGDGERVDDGARVLLPRLDLEVLEEVVAVRRDVMTGFVKATVGAEELDFSAWEVLIDAAMESGANSSATIAGLSPVAVRRWSSAFRVQGERSGVESGAEDAATGDVVAPAVPLPESPRVSSELPSVSLADASAQWELPEDRESWEVFRWQGEPAGLERMMENTAAMGRSWGTGFLLISSAMGWLILRRGGERARRLAAVLVIVVGMVTMVSSASIWLGLMMILLAIPGLFGRAVLVQREGSSSVVGTTATMLPATES